MLVVKDLQRNTEALTNIKNAEVYEEVNGDFSISFASFLSPENEHSYPLLQEESLLELEGQEFRVKKMMEVRNQKQVNALHIFFDLIEYQVYGFVGGTKTAAEIFSFILAGSGWTFEIVGDIAPKVFSNFGEGNAVKLSNDACTIFECERKIMPGKHLIITSQIGDDTDNQFRYRHNIKTLKKSVDTSNLRTVIKGFGADGLEVTYTSPLASVYGERHADPIRDDRYSVANSLLDRLKQELNDTPDISIEIEVTQLDFDANLGDGLWTIYEPLGIDIRTRISARKWYPFSKKAPTVTIENRKRTFMDILAQQKIEIDQNNKETRSRFEQTNERISMEVERVDESIATLQVEADNINIEVQRLDGDIQRAYSQIDVKAGEVLIESKSYTDDGINSAYNYFEGEIESVQSSIAVIAGTVELKASVEYVNSEINSVNSRVQSAEAVLNVQAGQISQKVSINDFNGNTIIQKVNLDAAGYTVDASKINLLGITNVANQLNIGESYNDSTAKGIYFRGPLGGVNIVSNTQGSLEIGALHTLYLTPTNLDLSMPSSIIWGNNAPVARFG